MDPHWLTLAERLQRRVYPTWQAPPRAGTRRATAYHESGHAVTLLLTGADVQHVTIEPSAISGGAVATGAIDSRWTAYPEPLTTPILQDAQRPWALAMAAPCFAGRIAEMIAAGLDWQGCYTEHESDDAIAAYILTAAFGPLRGSTPKGGAQALARLMLLKHWPTVSRLAVALLDRGTLDGAQIRHAMDRTDIPPMSCATAARRTSVAIGAQGMAR